VSGRSEAPLSKGKLDFDWFVGFGGAAMGRHGTPCGTKDCHNTV